MNILGYLLLRLDMQLDIFPYLDDFFFPDARGHRHDSVFF